MDDARTPVRTDPGPDRPLQGEEPAPPWAGTDPVSDDPRDWTVGRLLSAVARRVERDWNAHLALWDLNHASLPVLLHLLGGPHSQRELAVACAVTEQTMSRVLARLERNGHVTRASPADDRRRHEITITAAGRLACLQAADATRAEALVTDALDDQQLNQLRSLLAQVISAQVATHGADPDTTGVPT